MYRMFSYLIIDNVTEEDGGEYTFSSITTYTGSLPIHQSRTVNVTVRKYMYYTVIRRDLACKGEPSSHVT